MEEFKGIRMIDILFGLIAAALIGIWLYSFML